MNHYDGAVPDGPLDGVHRLPSLAVPFPGDFAVRVLRSVGVPAERYDTYVHVGTVAGRLYVASSPVAVTGAAFATDELTDTVFEERHRARTGRSAIFTSVPARDPGPAVRSGGGRRQRIELEGLTAAEAAVLAAVRAIPRGQLRPVSWVAREAALPRASSSVVTRALAGNPVAVLVPTHRVTRDDGVPCDLGYPAGAGQALRRAEGIDEAKVAALAAAGIVFIGSDTTHIFCHPTCSDARRISSAHRVPFGTARQARAAGYRECRRCRPVAA